MSVPDYELEETLDFKFTTRAFATGIPTTLAGGPIVEIYEDNGLGQITTAEFLTVDFDGVPGLNNLRVEATAANGFEAGKSYQCVLSVGTVGGVSVRGEVVAQFSIQRSPVNWANVTAASTAVDLSGTDIQLCDTTTDVSNGVAIAASAIGDAQLSGNLQVVFSTDFSTNYNTTRNAWATNVQDFVGTSAADPFNGQVVAASVTGAVGSLTGHTVQTGDSFAIVNGASGCVAIKAETALIVADTNELQTDDVPGLIATAQADLDTITGTDGVTLATAQALYAPALASVCTEARLAELDAANLPADIDTLIVGVVITDASSDAVIADAVWNAATVTYGGVGSYGEHVESLSAGGDATEAKQDQIIAAVITNAAGVDIAADIIAVKAETALIVADTNELQTDDIPALIATAQADLDTITGTGGVLLATAQTAAAWSSLEASAGQIIEATVDTVTNTHTPTTTEFQADDITEATADHYNGRIVIFTSGALAGQATSITDYEAVGGIGQFTVVAMTEAPANDDSFIIV